MKDKILTLSGFAAKAGKLSYGACACKTALKTRRAKAILCAEDLSEKSLKEITFFAEKSNVKVFSLKGIAIAELSQAVGHKCGIISVNEKGFAQSLEEEIVNDQ